MPALASISVNDGAATPLAHVFGPVTTDGSKASFANRAASVPVGQELLSIEVVSPKNTTQAYSVIAKGYLPTTATIDSNEQVIRYNSFELRVNLSQLSTTQERKNIRVMVSNLLAHATMASVIEGPEPIY